MDEPLGDGPNEATRQHSGLLIRMIESSIEAKRRFAADEAKLLGFERAVTALIRCFRRGGRLFIAGNGGSAADAQHLAAEFVIKLAKDRAPLPAEALTTDGSILTAVGNDYGFDEVFARQLRGKALGTDMFLGITTSGNSPNIIAAVKTARSLGIESIVLSGRDGETTSTIQETHIVIAHALCACVEEALFAGQ